MRQLVALLAALATPSTVTAAEPAVSPPRLIVVVTVDQMSPDLFERHRERFNGGLARLSKGAALQSAGDAAATVAALLRRGSPGSMVVSVSGKATASLPADRQWTWDGARFVAASETPSAAVANANAAIAAMIASAEPPLDAPDDCGGELLQPASRFARSASDSAAFEASPALDGATLAVSAAVAIEQGLGADATPDLLSITLPATANVAQRFGPRSGANCVQLFALDRDLEDFLRQLDGRRLDYAVILAGSAASAPLFLWRPRLPAGLVPNGDLQAALGQLLAVR